MIMTRHAMFAALAVVAVTAAHASGGAATTSSGTAGATAKTDDATCQAQADDRRLLGSDRSNFLKTCEKAARKPCTTIAVADRKIATPAASNALKCSQG